EIVVASMDGSGRTVVSAAPGAPHPTDAISPVWRPRDIDEVSVDATPVGAVTTGESVTVTVTATTARCGQGRLTLAGLDLPCVGGETVTVTAGSVVGSTWVLDRLAPGEAPTATITGRVDTVGDCGLTVTLHDERSTPRVVANAPGRAATPTCPSDPSPFTDVAPESFARGDVDCVHALGLTTGTGPSTYSPSAPVTRAQMAVFLARLWTVLDRTCPTARSPFVDVVTGDFGAREVDCVYGMGVTTGTSPSTFSPSAVVTREQMAAFLARTWRALGGACPSGPAPFVDVAAGSFARGDVDCIFALGITTGTGPSTFSPSTVVTREQMAAFLARLWRRAVADGLHVGGPAG
ncbi:MAG: S-layer homology domain-containing protein, partial [Actinomyces sp.]